MYLSKLTLNPRNRQVLREVAFPYEMHRTLLSAFPSGKFMSSEQKRCCGNALSCRTYRTGHVQRIGAVSCRTGLVSAAEGRTICSIGDRPKQFDLSIAAEQVLAFRLRANPTKRLSAGNRKKGKRVGLYSEEEQAEWIVRKAKLGGFEVARLTIGGATKIAHGKAKGGQRSPYYLQGVCRAVRRHPSGDRSREVCRS